MEKKINLVKNDDELSRADGFVKDHDILSADGQGDIFDGHIKDYRNAGGNPADADCLYDPIVIADPVLYEECINRDMGWDQDVELGYSLKEAKEERQTGFERFISGFGSVLTQVDRTADIYTKLKGGATTETEGGTSYDVSLGGQPSATKKDNTTWYFVGGAIVVLAVVAIVVMRNNK